MYLLYKLGVDSDTRFGNGFHLRWRLASTFALSMLR